MRCPHKQIPNTIFALFALVELRTPRTGLLVALDSAGLPLNLPLLLAAVVVGAAVGAVLVPRVGDAYLRAVRARDPATLSVSVLVGLVMLAALVGGGVGVAVFLAAGLVGFLPVRTGARRVSLMGALLLPVAL